MKTHEEQIAEAMANVKTGFEHFAQARRHLTIWEFERAVAEHLNDYGGQGFVVSIGDAIVAGAKPR